jgi:CheY-like chemotaxis protein
LCLNARDAFVDASRDIPSPHILVAVNQAQINGCSYACVLVKDNGIGMGEGVKQHIFEPFFTTKPIGQGTGLGLATAYGIVQGHRGWIECDSQENQGTTFVVYLPLEKDNKQIPQTPVAPKSVRKTDPLPVYSETLLVVDDEEIIRKTARDLLKLYGYRVIEAVDGPSGLAIYQTEKDRIDLVLMDLSMPGFSGLELLKRLLVINPEVRVIIMTGNLPDQMHIPDARAVLGKPLKSKEMFDVIRKILDEACPG